VAFGEPSTQPDPGAARSPADAEAERTRTAALLKQLLEAATDAIWIRDADGCFQVVNAAAAAIIGRPAHDVIGRRLDEIWPAQSAELLRQTQELFDHGAAITVEEEMFHSGLGETRTFLSNKVPLYAESGEPIGILGVSRDISDRKKVENELRNSEARLAEQLAEFNALYASAPIGLAFFSRDHRYLRVNQQLADINGVAIEDHVGRTIHQVIGEAGRAVVPIIDSVFKTGEVVREFEVSGVSPRAPDVLRHWLTGFYPVRGSGGDVIAVGAWIVEISERKAAEQRELLLAREVDHRAKNLLAVVQSIVQLTPAADAQDLKASIIGRIQALARAHSLLSDSRWDGVDLGALVKEELAPFASEEARLSFNGPDLRLRPAAAQSLALVLHELTTNAAKYGALSSARGSIMVEWKRVSDAAGPFIEIRWVEQGGPDPGQPELGGFGSKIIHASITRQLRGQVTKDWHEDGLRCTIRIPAAEVVSVADG
jgi:PAS domain S-box-containing protein